MLEKCRKEYIQHDDITAEERTTIPPSNWSTKSIEDKYSNTWSILMIIRSDEHSLPKVQCWLDPSIDIDKIKTEIIAGVPSSQIHPYHYKDEAEKMKPDLYYHRIKQEPRQYLFTEEKINGATYVCINKNYIGNNFLLPISPTATENSIKQAVLQAREMVLRGITEESISSREKGKRTFSSSDINYYIEWLKKYDEVTNAFKKLNDSKSIDYVKGAIIIQDRKIFKEIVQKIYYDMETSKEKTKERHKKNYDDAYKGAVQLIQSTPEIIFSRPRN